jgi:Predicted aminoglycoside phosphotransferase
MQAHETPAEVRDREEALVRSLLRLGAGDAVVFDDEGWDSRVYLVNGGEAVFKFPRSAKVRAQYVQEVAVLRLLEDAHDAVSTPRVRWESPSLEYIGLEGIVGDQLGHVIDELSESDKREIGGSLGRFVRHLHTLTLPNARVVTVEDEIEEFQRDYRIAVLTIDDHFTRGERRVLDDFFRATLPEAMRRLGSEPRLCHGDLGLYNIVVDGSGRPGVIDFGDLGVFDRSKDFIGLDDGILLHATVEAYGADETLGDRIAIRSVALPVLDLPFHIANHDEDGIAGCLNRIRSSLLAEGAPR